MGMKMPKGKYMCSVKVGEKGQIVIPKAIRDMFDIAPGDSILLMVDEKRGIAVVPYDDFTGGFGFPDGGEDR